METTDSTRMKGGKDQHEMFRANDARVTARVRSM